MSTKIKKTTTKKQTLAEEIADLQKAFSVVKLPKNFDVVKFIKKWR